MKGTVSTHNHYSSGEQLNLKHVTLKVTYILYKTELNPNFNYSAMVKILPLDEEHELSLSVCGSDNAVWFLVGLTCRDLRAVIVSLFITSLNELHRRPLVSLHIPDKERNIINPDNGD